MLKPMQWPMQTALTRTTTKQLGQAAGSAQFHQTTKFSEFQGIIMANKNHHVKLSLIAALAASAINCVIVSRETGIVAIATSRSSGNDNPDHFLVSSALVGTGDNFKLWQGVGIALERAAMGEGLIYRFANVSPETVLGQYVEDNHYNIYPDSDIYSVENVESIGKMLKAATMWDEFTDDERAARLAEFGAPRMADSVVVSKDTAWPFPTGSMP
jgi:hypothetical protein